MTNSDLKLSSIYLSGSDVAVGSACYITLVTQGHANLFGGISEGVMCLSRVGEIIQSIWLRLPNYFPIHQDIWSIMPNHLHAIVWLIDLGNGSASKGNDGPTPWHVLEETLPNHHIQGSLSGSLDAIIQNYKAVTSRKVHQYQANESIAKLSNNSNGLPRETASRLFGRLWKRSYYSQMIGSQAELDQVRRYISENPHRWCEDEQNMERPM